MHERYMGGKGDSWKWVCSFRFQKGYFYYSRFLFLRQFHTIILYKLALCQSVEFSIECAKLFMFISMKDFICVETSLLELLNLFAINYFSYKLMIMTTAKALKLKIHLGHKFSAYIHA